MWNSMEEMHVLLKNRGKINPRSSQEYADRGGFEALKKALSMDSEAIIDVIRASGLRGRGGAGFPTYRKMEFTAHASDPTRYIVCNADEGEPGTNKDRILLSTDPCAVFEGMAIAGKAVGAHTGYIYLRAEYTYLFPVLKDALEDAEKTRIFRKKYDGERF